MSEDEQINDAYKKCGMSHNRNVNKKEIWGLFIIFEEWIREDFIEEVILIDDLETIEEH